MAQKIEVSLSDLETIERLIENAELERARYALRAFDNKLPRSLWVKYAELCRRCGLLDRCLRLLGPVCAPDAAPRSQANPEERTEYAGSLIQLGLTHEGRRHLTNAGQHPAARKIALFESFAAIKEWDYLNAIDPLLHYLNFDLSDYERRVGETNLLACYIAEEQWPAAQKLIAHLKNNSLKPWTRLQQNLNELELQYCVLSGSYKKAFGKIEQQTLSKNELEDIHYRKWRMLLELKSGRSNLKQLSKDFSALRVLSLRQKNWETLRDLDAILALEQKDTQRLQRVLAGTPYPSFKRRLINDARKVWQGDIKESEFAEVLWWNEDADIQHGRFPVAVKRTMKLHSLSELDRRLPSRLILALLADTYRPANVPQLFNRVFSSEYYHPMHSTNRIHQLLLRARLILKETPFFIAESLGTYRLDSKCSNDAIRIVRSLGAAPARQSKILFEKINELIKASRIQIPFSISDIEENVEAPRRSLQRHLSNLCEVKLLTREGQRKASLYRLSSQVVKDVRS